MSRMVGLSERRVRERLGEIDRARCPALDVMTTPHGPQVRTRAVVVLAEGHTRWRTGAVQVRDVPLPSVPALHHEMSATPRLSMT